MYRQIDRYAEFKRVIHVKKSHKIVKNTLLPYFFRNRIFVFFTF